MQEINELKNLVIQGLEANGILGQIRAQIRASVFKIVETQETGQRKNAGFFWENPQCQTIYDHNEGQVALEIINDFLNYFKMDYTTSVFSNESNLRDAARRDELQKKLGVKVDDGKPVLFQLINALSSGGITNKENQGAPITSGRAVEPIQKAAPKPEPVQKTSENLEKNKAAGAGKLEQLQEDKSFPSLARKGDKLAPLSSISPQSKEETYKTQNNQLAGNQGIKRLGLEENKPPAVDFKNAGDVRNNNAAKFKQAPESDEENYEDEVFENVEEELVEDLEEEEDDNPKNKERRSMQSSSEDIIGASQSQGFDVSVDSLALEDYDYIEDANRILLVFMIRRNLIKIFLSKAFTTKTYKALPYLHWKSDMNKKGGKNANKNKEKAPDEEQKSLTPASIYLKDGKTHIVVDAKPNSKQSAVTGISDDGVKVNIAAPPKEGEANKELVEFLAGVVGAKKSEVYLDKGSKSKSKIVVVESSDAKSIYDSLKENIE